MKFLRRWSWSGWAAIFLLAAGCQELMRQTDRDVAAIIRERQRAAVASESPAGVNAPEELPPAPRRAYQANPRPSRGEIPASFSTPSSAPASQPIRMSLAAASGPASAPARGRDQVFTLTEALGYADLHRRELEAAKEDLYTAALALTLERHLWTPIFASQFQTVYGNYGEARDFDQAMRFVGDLSMTQRLPYGGEVTAKALGTLIRDVKKTITAQEGSRVELGLKVPVLRGAGDVAQENLVRLERELTYAVRVFERFRRQQLVLVAQAYFDLLRGKQQVIDNQIRLVRAGEDLDRAQAMEDTGERTPLDTQRAELAVLDAENTLQSVRESFRSQTDEFKLLIGMPLDEPLERDDLEDIETIERGVDAGEYPLLARPLAVEEEAAATQVALQQRLDVLTARDQIDDARRGVEVSRNAMLPALDWQSTLSFDTDPNHYSVSRLHVDRANWLTQLTLELPLERTAERNRLRESLIRVRAAQRNLEDATERVRVEVRGIVNRLRLQERTLEIQQRRVEVAGRQREFAQIQFEDGKIDNRDKVEAETAYLDAQNSLNQAKTQRWSLILQFRLATETLLVDGDTTVPVEGQALGRVTPEARGL